MGIWTQRSSGLGPWLGGGITTGLVSPKPWEQGLLLLLGLERAADISMDCSQFISIGRSVLINCTGNLDPGVEFKNSDF